MNQLNTPWLKHASIAVGGNGINGGKYKLSTKIEPEDKNCIFNFDFYSPEMDGLIWPDGETHFNLISDRSDSDSDIDSTYELSSEGTITSDSDIEASFLFQAEDEVSKCDNGIINFTKNN